MNFFTSFFKNPTFQKVVLVGASAAAGAYAGPAGSAAVAEYLPKIAQFFGLGG